LAYLWVWKAWFDVKNYTLKKKNKGKEFGKGFCKGKIDRIVFANHSWFTRVKPTIVRNIESSFILFIFVITNEQYLCLNPQKIVFSTWNRFICFKLRISTSKFRICIFESSIGGNNISFKWSFSVLVSMLFYLVSLYNEISIIFFSRRCKNSRHIS
jgi:hypothetical protein